MSTKRKISIRKVLQAIFTLVLTGGCITAILSASKNQQNEKLKGVFIHIKNEEQYPFLDKEAVLKSIISSSDLTINETKLTEINVRAIERQVYKNPWAAEAQVYVDNQCNLQIYATQHTPSARVFFENGQSCYLNDSLSVLPTSDKFTYYTTVVTNVPRFNDDSLNFSARAKIISLVKTIERDNFWNAQVEQIAMTPDMYFEIYPVLGTHKILFGDTTLATRKLENLFGFYKNILNKIGWDKYQVLDARFNDQIVASPALAWKMPAKGFISNMDWVKTLMGDEPKDVSNTQLDMSLATNYPTNVSNTPPAVKVPAIVAKPVTTTAPPVSKTISPKTPETSKPSAVNNQAASEKTKTVITTNEKAAASETKKQEKSKTEHTQEKKEDPKPKYILN